MTENQIQGMATSAMLEYYGVSGRCTCDSYATALQVIIERAIRVAIDETIKEVGNGSSDLRTNGSERGSLHS
jgi:hypothetical protein